MDRIGITFFVLCFAVGVPSLSGQNYGKNEKLCKLRLALTWLSSVLQFVFTSKTGFIQIWRLCLVRGSFAQPMGSVLRKIDEQIPKKKSHRIIVLKNHMNDRADERSYCCNE